MTYDMYLLSPVSDACNMYHNNRHNYTQIYYIYTLTTPINMTCTSSLLHIGEMVEGRVGVVEERRWDGERMQKCADTMQVGVICNMYHNNRHNVSQ
jgi:hypothetical protein